MTRSFWDACARAIERQTFYNAFRRTFDIIEADTEALRHGAFRLRYKVFIAENRLDLDHHNGLEFDEYDSAARHFLLIHRQTGGVAGTVRVVLPDPDRPLSSFPLQKLCDHPFLHNGALALQLCEISRLCMAREFRRRPCDGSYLPAYYEQEESVRPGALRRRIPYAPLGLFHAAFGAALESGALNCIAIADPLQFRSLKKLGMDYRVLGPRLAGFGRQQPLVLNIKTVLDGMAEKNRACWEVISDRGRLAGRANELARYEWHDSIFDDTTRENLLEKLL